MEVSSISLNFRDNKLLLAASVGGAEVNFLVDSGANVSVLPYHIARDAGLLGSLSPLEACLKNSVAEYSPTIHGMLREPLQCAGGLTLRPLLVVMSPAIPILGMDALAAHRCVLTCSRLRPFLLLREPHLLAPAPLLPHGTHVSCTIKGQPTLALLDTGSTCCFMSRRLARALRLAVRRVGAAAAATITGSVPIVGQTSAATVTFLGLSATTTFCLSDVDERVVIGLNVLLDANVRLQFDAKMIPKGES